MILLTDFIIKFFLGGPTSRRKIGLSYEIIFVVVGHQIADE